MEAEAIEEEIDLVSRARRRFELRIAVTAELRGHFSVPVHNRDAQVRKAISIQVRKV